MARVLKHKDSEEEESKGAESLVLPAIQADIQEGQGGCTWEQGLDQRQDTRAAPVAPEEQGPSPLRPSHPGRGATRPPSDRGAGHDISATVPSTLALSRAP